MRIIILIQSGRVVLKPVERIPGNEHPHSRRIIPRIQVIQPGLRVPPVPGVAVRVYHAAGGSDMIPERVVIIRGHHCTSGIGQRHHVAMAVVVVVIHDAAAHHGQQLAISPVDIAGEQVVAAIGFVEHAGAGAVVEDGEVVGTKPVGRAIGVKDPHLQAVPAAGGVGVIDKGPAGERQLNGLLCA